MHLRCICRSDCIQLDVAYCAHYNDHYVPDKANRRYSSGQNRWCSTQGIVCARDSRPCDSRLESHAQYLGWMWQRYRAPSCVQRPKIAEVCGLQFRDRSEPHVVVSPHSTPNLVQYVPQGQHRCLPSTSFEAGLLCVEA